jgi:hypothetical protein
MRFLMTMLLFLPLGCAPPDRSILTQDGDEALDCAELKAEFDFAAASGRKAMCDAAQNLNFNWCIKIF